MKKFFTSESVTEGHPDKLCDYISDSILDEYLALDEYSRVAIETVAGKDTIFVTGEVSSNANLDIEKIVRRAIMDIDYFGNVDIDYKTCNVIINISNQSPDIKIGVDKSLETKNGDILGEGAGDQGIMFGYACNDTEEYMPYALSFAHALSRRLIDVRKQGIIDYIGADGKTQVTVEYDDDKIKRIDAIVISIQHRENIEFERLEYDIKKFVIDEVIPKKLLDEDTKYFINPTGRFVIGGPLGDSGLTGRKTIVDTYGGYAHHGGGAFSGKDATKVDRSASYMARFLAKNIVANNYAEKCEIQLSYAIGVAKPISIFINTFNTNKIPEKDIIDKIINNFDLTPKGIIEYLELRKPIYKSTTNYGHFGKNYLSWERVIKL